MNSRALIKETLKYLETNENGQPKYRFDVYKNGLVQSGNRAISMLTGGIINNAIATDKNEPVPVSVYTISDIFHTVQETTGDILRDIEGLPDTLENIKVSLKELGYTAIDRTISTLKAAIVPIEVVQTINQVYRIAKPLVKKVKDIAQIMFYYPAAAEVAQDVLSYLSRLAFSTAKNYLGRLFEIMMDTPVFAIYENSDDTINLSGAYSQLSDAANNMLDDIVLSEEAFSKIMSYANSSSDKIMYEPSYNNLGISIPEDIVDVFHDYKSRKIFIASTYKIYELNEDYTVKVIYDDHRMEETDRRIEKIFYDNSSDKVYYIANIENNEYGIYDTDSWSSKIELISPKIIFSDPCYIYSNNKIYSINSTWPIFRELYTLKDDVVYSTSDFDDNTIYYISSTKKLYKLAKNLDDTFSEEKIFTFDVNDTIGGMAYFNGMLYIIRNNYVTKVNAGLSFNTLNYLYNGKSTKEGIIYTNGSLATNGTFFYEQSNNLLSNPRKALSSINCITAKRYKNEDYYVATGGNKIYVTRAFTNCSTSWFSKELENNTIDGDITGTLNENGLPDNVAGCLWLSGNNFIAYSQKNIYYVGSKYMSDIFDLPPAKESEKMPYKEFAKFEKWWDTDESEPTPTIRITKKVYVGDCIITGMKIVNGTVYVALFNPLYGESSQNVSVKTGIYKVITSRYDLNIDYGNPLYVAGTNNPKIYSFDYIDNCWYYTDGKNLFNISTATNTNLNLDTDRVLTIAKNNNKVRLFTSQAILDAVETKDYGKITSSVNYTAGTIASTKNVLMIADSDFVYNIVDNGEDGIYNEMFQICYKKDANAFNLMQSCNAAFIVSKNVIKKVPFYDSITSLDYGCGYYTDTTPNKWYGAAPYYFASNVLNNNGKNAYSRNMFIKSFTENFKIELEKLLKHIPDAFVTYTTEKLIASLKEAGVEINGDDGQIANLLIESVASTTANSLGMYVHDKFMEKIGDDETYETFAENVYQACLADYTNNMTEDFYKIFEELYLSTLTEALASKDFGPEGISSFLLRYYQNHKAEWAKSMTDLIDIDIVDPDIYEEPLKTTKQLKQTTYRFDYDTGAYKYEYMSSIPKNLDSIDGYLRDGEFYDEASGGEVIDQRTYDSSAKTWSINNEVICYKNPENDKFYKYKIDDFTLSEDTEPVFGTPYCTKTDESEQYVPTSDTTEENKLYYRPEYSITNDTSVISEKSYFAQTGGTESYVLQPASEATLPDDVYFEKQEYWLTTDTEIEHAEIGGIKTVYIYDGNDEATGVTKYSVSSATESANGEYVKVEEGSSYYYVYDPSSSGTKYIVEFTEDISGKYLSYNLYESEKIYTKTYYEPSYVQVQVGETIVSNKQYYIEDYIKTQDTTVDQNKTYYEYLDFDGYGGEEYYAYNPDASTKYLINFTPMTDTYFNEYETYYIKEGAVYKFAEDLDLQNGPFYVISDLTQDVNGEYELKTFDGSESGYKQVTSPITDDLSRYYESTYTKIQTPSASDIAAGKIYKIEFIPVENPNNTEISTYYEKEESFVVAKNLNYNQAGEVINDRKLYKMINSALVYTEILSPSGNPNQQGWYEISNYDQIIPGSSINPQAEGLYERIYNPDEYTEVDINEHFEIYDDETSVIRCDVEFEEDENGEYVEEKTPEYFIAYDGETGVTRYDVIFEDMHIYGEGEYVLDSFYKLYNGEVGVTRYDVTFEENDEWGTYIKIDDKYIYAPDSTQTPKYLALAFVDSNGDYFWAEEYRYAPTAYNRQYSVSSYEENVNGDYFAIEFEKTLYKYDPTSAKTPKYSVSSYEENASGDYYWVLDDVRSPLAEGWYNFTSSYYDLYDDGKVYINLAAVEIPSDFPDLDDEWHNAFYDSVAAAGEALPDYASIQEAIEALESISYPEPSWGWKALINEAVTTLYIPTQGEQYRAIIRDSNMYPIQWQELPSDINRKSFDYALTTLLYMIKQGLLTNITILVDGGQVKCYSCVDASTVIQKIINRNNIIWRNQIRIAKKQIEESHGEISVIKAAFNMIKAFDPTLYLLENILNQQSALYAKYIDMLIEEQIINDNETEVSL